MWLGGEKGQRYPVLGTKRYKYLPGAVAGLEQQVRVSSGAYRNRMPLFLNVAPSNMCWNPMLEIEPNMDVEVVK